MSEPDDRSWRARFVLRVSPRLAVPWLHFAAAAASLIGAACAWRAGSIGWVLVAVPTMVGFVVTGIASACVRRGMRDRDDGGGRP